MIETVPNPWYKYICRRGGAGKKLQRGHFLIGPRKINYAMDFFNMMKKMQLKGYNNVLFLQDDVLFHKDLDFIKKLLDNTPEDYDIVNYDPGRGKGWLGNGRGCWGHYYDLKGNEVPRNWDEELFVRYNSVVYRLDCVAMTKRAIDHIVKKDEEILSVGDWYTWKDTGDLKTYCTTGNNYMTLQDVRFEEKMSDDYDMDTLYKDIDLSNYGMEGECDD